MRGLRKVAALHTTHGTIIHVVHACPPAALGCAPLTHNESMISERIRIRKRLIGVDLGCLDHVRDSLDSKPCRSRKVYIRLQPDLSRLGLRPSRVPYLRTPPFFPGWPFLPPAHAGGTFCQTPRFARHPYGCYTPALNDTY